VCIGTEESLHGDTKQHRYLLCSGNIWGKLMTFKKITALLALSAWLVISFLGCGEETAMYQYETLTFETPVSSKMVKKNTLGKNGDDLDLGDKESSDFRFVELGPVAIPWGGPIPLYDYYLQPLPVQVPVSPFYSVVEFIHPFYVVAGFDLLGKDRFGDDEDYFFDDQW
jgi:hypothetical protein